MRTLGVEVSYEPELDAPSCRNVSPASTCWSCAAPRSASAALDAGKALNLIIRAGAGVNNIDVATASERGIYVANCPGKTPPRWRSSTFTLIGSPRPPGSGRRRQPARRKWEKDEFARADRACAAARSAFWGWARRAAPCQDRSGLRAEARFAWSRSLTAANAADLGVCARQERRGAGSGLARFSAFTWS